MMRSTVAVVFLVAGLVEPLAGQSADCMPNQGCPGNVKQPGCCEEPPCQLEVALQRMQAFRRMMSEERVEKALRVSNDDDAKAIASLRAAVNPQWSAPPGCNPGEGFFALPDFRVSSSCQVQVRKGSGWSDVPNPLSLVNEFDGCNELIDAAYAQAAQWKELCVGAVPKNARWWAMRQRAGATAFIDVLNDHKDRFWRACSSMLAPPERQQAIQDALGASLSSLQGR
jgi:hypothetical protein